jgi:colicin import membrane protein
MSFDPSFHPYRKQFLWIVAVVCGLHLVLLVLGSTWESILPQPIIPPKLIVQTIQLSPPSSIPVREIVSKESAEESIPQIIEEIVLAKVEELEKKEEIKKEKIELKGEELAMIHHEPLPPIPPLPAPKVKEPPKAQPPPPVKIPKESPPKEKPKPPQPKKEPPPAVQKKNTNLEKPKVEKKPEIEQKAKPVVSDSIKKKEQEQAAEKKRQQEKAAFEKKKEQEKVESEKAAKQKIFEEKMKQNLTKLSESRNKISSSSAVDFGTISLPKEVKDLEIDAFANSSSSTTWQSAEIKYEKEVEYRLKMGLRLPEYGTVKIRLTLDRSGKVILVETMESQSDKNKKYAEEKIPHLLFPSFGNRFPEMEKKPFVIALQNEKK